MLRPGTRRVQYICIYPQLKHRTKHTLAFLRCPCYTLVVYIPSHPRALLRTQAGREAGSITLAALPREITPQETKPERLTYAETRNSGVAILKVSVEHKNTEKKKER